MASKATKSFQIQNSEFDSMIRRIIPEQTTKNMNTDKFIQLNADFIYLMALFERFLGNFIIYLVHRKKNIKHRYQKMFESLCAEKVKTLKNADSWTIYYNNPKKMIDDYAVLEKEKNCLVILREIIKDDVNLSERSISNALNIYSEARARRNLLAHRGSKPDKLYEEEIKRAKLTKKLQRKILGYGLYRYSTRSEDISFDRSGNRIRKDNNVDNPIDLSVTPSYLNQTCINLIFIKECLLMDLRTGDFNSNLHDFISNSIENKNPKLQDILVSIFRRKIDLYSKATDLDIDEKVNFILLTSNIAFPNNSMRKKATNFNKELIGSIGEKDHELAKYIKPLLLSYISKNKIKFLEGTKDILNHKIDTIIEVRNWLLFKKYLKFKEFKKLFDDHFKKLIKSLKN